MPLILLQWQEKLGLSVLFEKQCRWVLLVLNIKRFDGYKRSWPNSINKIELSSGSKIFDFSTIKSFLIRFYIIIHGFWVGFQVFLSLNAAKKGVQCSL